MQVKIHMWDYETSSLRRRRKAIEGPDEIRLWDPDWEESDIELVVVIVVVRVEHSAGYGPSGRCCKDESAQVPDLPP